MQPTKILWTKRAASLRLVCLWAILAALPALGDAQTKVSLTAAETSLREVVSTLARQANVEVRFLPGVSGQVSVTIRDVPFTEALTTVLGTADYAWRREGAVFVVGRFSGSTAAGAEKSVVVPLRHASASTLARALGWLDLATLAGSGSTVDLRALLPTGLEGPPRPTADDRGLEVAGTPAAVSDFQYLVGQLDQPTPGITYRWLLATADSLVVDDLRVSWAQGVMQFGSSDEGREVLYTAADLAAQWRRLNDEPAGLHVLGKGTMQAQNLEVRTVNVTGTNPYRLAMVSRIEDGLALKLFASCELTLDDEPVSLVIDGGPLPPEEGALIVSRQIPGGPGPETVLLIIVPSVVDFADLGE